MSIRKLILYCSTVALLSAPLSEAKTGKPAVIKNSGKPSKFKTSRHSKPKKQKSGFKKNRGGIKH